jgi:hypothetical protein
LLLVLLGCRGTLNFFAASFYVLASATEGVASGQGGTQQKYGNNGGKFFHDIPFEKLQMWRQNLGGRAGNGSAHTATFPAK